MNKAYHKILYVSLLVLMFVPMTHHLLGFKINNQLRGAYIPEPLPKLNYVTWTDLSFQDKFEKHIEDHIGLRPEIIRLTNQINYSLFRELNPRGIVVGENKYLYEIPYVITKAGKDYVGIDSLKRIVNKIRALELNLQKHNTKLLVLLAPDKVTFMPENLPDKYRKRKPVDSTNYKIFSYLLRQDSIPFIDFNTYFLQLKDTATYPLYPKYGTHWSSYGWSFGVDTVIKKLEYLSDSIISKPRIKKYEVSSKLRDTDYDIGECLNLIFQLPGPDMAYPVFEFDTTNWKPKVLVFGDSYWVNIANTSIPEKVFESHDLNYYDKRIFNDPEKSIRIPDDYKNYNFVIIEVTNANIRLLGGWNF